MDAERQRRERDLMASNHAIGRHRGRRPVQGCPLCDPAAPAVTETDHPLDVERLARAMHNGWEGEPCPDPDCLDIARWRRDAANLAREYAALATPPAERAVVEVEGKDGVVHRVWATPPAEPGLDLCSSCGFIHRSSERCGPPAPAVTETDLRAVVWSAQHDVTCDDGEPHPWTDHLPWDDAETEAAAIVEADAIIRSIRAALAAPALPSEEELAEAIRIEQRGYMHPCRDECARDILAILRRIRETRGG